MVAEKTMWQKPEMTVLVRNRPEEAVLTACKNTSVNTGTKMNNNACMTGPGGSGKCDSPCLASPPS